MAYPTRHRKQKQRAVTPQRSRSEWLNLAIGPLLAISILAAYGQVRRFDFVNYDDPANLSQNAHVRAGLSAGGFELAFTSGELGNWLPVTRISYLADRQWFQLDPGAAHSINLFFHLCASLLLFALLYDLTGSRWRSLFVAAYFREALRLRPNDPKAYNNLGIALATQGEAIDDFRAAIRLDPEYANAEFNLGAALANSGRLQEAMTHLSTAVRLQPDDRRARQSLESVAALLRENGH